MPPSQRPLRRGRALRWTPGRATGRSSTSWSPSGSEQNPCGPLSTPPTNGTARIRHVQRTLPNARPRPDRISNPPSHQEVAGDFLWRRLCGGTWLQVGDQADVDAFVDEVVLAALQVPHVAVVVLLIGGRDRRVLIALQRVGPD